MPLNERQIHKIKIQPAGTKQNHGIMGPTVEPDSPTLRTRTQ
jgi:hypothetical protein